jgi:hypothetical protein
MSYNDIEFTFDFAPILKSLEKIQATVQFVVGGGSDFRFALLIPFVSIEPEKQVIRQILFAEGDAIAHRWALQFASAEEMLDRSAYQSLTDQLSAIESSQFNIRRALVRQIIPLSAPPKEVPAPKAPKQTRCEAEIADLNETVSTLDELSKWEARSRKKYQELWGDDFLGDLMRRKIEHKKASILTNRRAV